MSPGGGSYTTTTNWNPNGTPSFGDTANFSSGFYTVTFPSFGSVMGATFNVQSSANLTLSLGMNAFVSPSAVTLVGGTSTTVSFTGSGATFNTTSITGDGTSSHITFQPSNNSQVALNGTAESNGSRISVNFSGQGTLTTNGATIGDLNAGSPTATTSLTNSLTLTNSTSANSSYAGQVTGGGSFVVSGGSLTLTNSSNSFSSGVTVNTGASFIIPSMNCMGSGTLTLAGGTFAPSSPITTSQSTSVTASSTLNASGGAFTHTGTLTGSGGATLGTSGTVSLNTLSCSSGTFTVSGNLSGSQALTAQGGGTVVLSGSNSYTGGTVIASSTTLSVGSASNIGGGSAALTLSGGTLQTTGAITSSGAFGVTSSSTLNASGGAFTHTGTLTGSGGATLSSSGTVSLNTLSCSSGTFTVSGNLSGSQTLTAQDGGTVVLSGTNSYTGGTVIASATTLSIGSVSNIGGSGAALTLSGGTLQTSGAVTSSGAIGVTSSSTIDGSGGAATFTGTLTGSDTSTLTCSGTVSLNTVTLPSGTFTISGPLGGSQAFTKAGGGTLIMNSANTYTQLTTIAAGTLTFSSASTAGPVTVASGATFNGVGTIGGTLTLNGGTLQPGNSPGTMVITGDFDVTDPASIIAIEVTDTGQTSLLDITGSADLNGNGVLQFTADAGTYMKGMSFTFLTASGGVNGKFASSNIDSVFAGLNPDLVYNANSVELFLLPDVIPINPTLSGGISTSGLTGNNLALANYLNSLSASQLGPSFTTLSELEGSDLDQALSTLSPSRNSFSTYVSEITLFSCSSLLNAHSSALRLVRGSSTSSPLVAKNKPPAPSNCPSTQSLNPHCESTEVSAPPSCSYPFSLWATGFGELARQKAANQNPRFHVQTGGAMLGFDWADPHFVQLGIAAAYFHSTIDQSENFGDNTLDAGSLGLYSTLYASHFYLETSLWNGIESIQNRRNVFFSDFSEVAKSHHNAYIGDAHLGIGYDCEFQRGSFHGIFEPFANVDWAWDWEAQYKERGASPYNMQFKSHFSSMLQAEAGAYFYAAWDLADGMFILKQKASYLFRTPFHVGTISSNLVGFPGSFTVAAFTQNQNLFSPSTELLWRARNGSYGSVLYDGEFSSTWMLNELVVRIGKYF
jgi:autotransporter-associated beta strand protein